MSLKYAQIVDEEKGLCAVGLGEDTAGYEQLGMALQDVEQSDVDEQWYLKDKCPHLSDDEKLSKAQNTKHQELKRLMNDKRTVLKVSYDNDTFDANEDAQANMIVLLKAFDLGVTSVDIRSSTETTHSFNQSQCNELSLLMVSAVNSLYSTYWDLKDKLYACTTKEEIEAINWE